MTLATLRARAFAAAQRFAAMPLADEPPNDEEEQRDDESRTAVLAVIGRGHRRLAALALALLAGHLSRASFIAQATALLHVAVVHGATLGGAESAQAAAIADALLGKQREYLDGFADDLGGADAPSAAQAHDRAGQYLGMAWAGFQVGRGEAARTEGKTLVYWDLAATAAHCPDCPTLADESPYTLDEMPTWPGMGGTRCGGKCRCEARFERG